MWVEERRAPAADLTITCNTETYLLCLYGRVEWIAAKQDGRIIKSRTMLQPDGGFT
jgi:hypothetical protein